ncbi:MAG: FAD-binding protein [Coriobacteriales bacterium]|jgi:succinate dehydrogenase/fumarate reductase flavoprotein subunit|nr:FAD-binding protein [Coriobacteriales bacterium]
MKKRIDAEVDAESVEELTSEQISRRSFIKGAGLMGATLAAGTLAACATEKPATGIEGGDAAAITWDQETDVVIIGFGGAGGCAAIEAANAGANVLVLEVDKYEERLSNTRMSGGIFHSPDPAGDKQALRDYLRAMFSGENLPTKTEGEQSPLFIESILDKFVEVQPTTKDFVASLDPDVQIIDFGGPAFPQFPGAEAAKYTTFIPSYNGGAGNPNFLSSDGSVDKMDTSNGLALMLAIENALEDRKDKVQILWETYGKSLIRNTEGTIIGVQALQGGIDGRPINIKAKRSVVITSGGYEYNEEMRRAFLEGPGITGWAFYGTTSNDGSGIRMGVEVGAQIAKAGKAASRMIFSCPDITHNGLRVGSITEGVGTAGTYCVNAEGNRFMDETLITRDPSRYFSYKEAVKMDITKLEFPNIPSYLIMDETRRVQSPLCSLNGSTAGWKIIPWDEKNDTPVEKGWMYKADTIEELAQKIKDGHDLNRGRLDVDNFVAAYNEYQAVCATGEDPHFGRALRPNEKEWVPVATPPFYALPIVAGGPNTKGGLQADGERHVIDWDNQIIPRLYTAGEVSSVFKFVYQAGGNITECLVCGRIAGINAAAETPWE